MVVMLIVVWYILGIIGGCYFVYDTSYRQIGLITVGDVFRILFIGLSGAVFFLLALVMIILYHVSLEDICDTVIYRRK